MGTFLMVGALLALVLGFMGQQRRAALRSAARWILRILFAISAATTLFCLYGTFAWAGNGGGVLIFLAVIFGFVAFMLGNSLFASTDQEKYYKLDVDQKIQANLELTDRIEADHRAQLSKNLAERGRFWTSARRRENLDREIALSRVVLSRIDDMRRSVQRPEIYQGDEPGA